MNPCQTEFSSCYLHHIGRWYWSNLQEQGFIDAAFHASPIFPLANYYQFFREVLFALHQQGKFILLHDERNPAFVRKSSNGNVTTGLWPFLLRFVPEYHLHNIGRITIQDVVRNIEKSGRHDDWIGEFKSKYGLPWVQENVL